MAVVRTLTVSMTANTTKFNRNVKGAQTRLGKFRKAVFSVRGALIGLGGAAVLGAFKKTANEIDRVAKLSDRIGVGTERLIGLGHAAELTGGSIEGVAKGMERFAQSMGEAQQGLSTPLRALETLGIESESFLKQDLDTQLLQVADAMAKLDNQQQRVAASAQLFGRGGKELVNLLQGGSKDIKEFTKQADQLGIVFSRDEASRVEAFNDAWSDLSAVFRGVAQTVVIDLAPALIDLVAAMMEVLSVGARVKQGYSGLFSVFKYIGSGIGGHAPMSRKSLDKEIQAQERAYLAFVQRLELLQKRIRNRKITPQPDTRARVPKGALTPVGAIGDPNYSSADAAQAFETIADHEADVRSAADAARDFGGAMSGALDSAVVRGNDLRGVMQGLLQDIASLTLRKTITEPFVNMLGGIAGGLFGGGAPAQTVNDGLQISMSNQLFVGGLGQTPTSLAGPNLI